jgi:hypothetical protein
LFVDVHYARIFQPDALHDFQRLHDGLDAPSLTIGKHHCEFGVPNRARLTRIAEIN